MHATTYLTFDGRCREAFELYAKALGGQITFMQSFSESPMSDQAAPDWQDKIMHATIKAGDIELMGADAPPDRYSTPSGFAVSLQMQDPKGADRIFELLSAGGKIDMPLQETFWAARFGMWVDRFGTPWMINCEMPKS